MFRVAADNPDVPVSAQVSGGTDSEGNEIQGSDFQVGDIVSDNEAAVSIVDGEAGKAAHFGAPGVANLTCQVSHPASGLSFSLGAQVEVHAGAPVAVTGGIVLEGLQEDQPPTEPTA